jgi:phosphotransferase family enzyme
MNTRTDAFGPGETGGVSVGDDDSPLFLTRLDRSRRLPPGWQAHTWITDVLADIGMLGGPLRSSAEACRVEERSIRVLRSHRWPLVVGDLVGMGGAPRTVVAKAYRDDRGAATLALLHRLSAGGLGHGSFRVTAGLGWSSTFRVLVTECAPGEAWSDFLAQGGRRLEIASAAVGGWLRTLQGMAESPMPVLLPNRAEFRAEADMLVEATHVGSQYPCYSRRLEDLTRAALAMSAASAVRETTLVPSHGDLHPHNIHIDFNRADVVATALDLDTAGFRRPSYDVGYAVAQLLIMSVMRCGSFLPGALAAEAFWSGAMDPARPWCADEAAVSAQATRALVQSLHYELVTLHNGREDLLPAWCAVAEEALSAGVSAMLRRLLRGWRP